MAENTDPKTAFERMLLNEKSWDTLLNGDDNTDVVTWRENVYPSVQKVYKQLFENGGIPATPFRTKSEMIASDLKSGAYAIVTDSTPEANGLYAKYGDEWRKSSYDIAESVLSKTTAVFETWTDLNNSNLKDGSYALVNNSVEDVNGFYKKVDAKWVRVKYDPILAARSTDNAALLSRATDINIDTKNSKIVVTSGRVVVNKKTFIISDKEVSYDPDSTSHTLLVYNSTTDNIDLVEGSNIDSSTDSLFVIGSFYTLYRKPILRGVGNYSVDGAISGEMHYTTSSLVISDADAIRLDFKNNRIVFDRGVWIPYGDSRIYVEPQTIALRSNRNPNTKIVVTYDTFNRLIRLREVSATYSLPVYEVVLFAYHEAKGVVYGLDIYTLNGDVVGVSSGRVSAYHLALFNRGDLDINFAQKKLILKGEMWVPLASERVLVPPQEVDFTEDWLPNSSTKHLITLDLSTKELSIHRNLGSFKIPSNSILIGAVHDKHSTIWGLEGATINGQFPDSSNNPTLSYGFPTTNFINLGVTDSFVEGQDSPHLQIIRSWTVYEWYDALVEQYPDYVSKVNLGKDASGEIDIFEYIFRPPRYNNEGGKPAEIPRVMIQALHNEQVNFVYPYIVMREICQNWHAHDGLEGLRWGTEIRVIPVLNPWGLDNASRTNSNGVDINRNYPYGWELKTDVPDVNSGQTPLSENETKVSYQEMLDFKPHVMIDCHSFGGFKEDGRSVWFTSLSDNDLEPITDCVVASFANYKKRYDWLEPMNSAYRVLDSRVNLGTAADARHSLGMRGGTIEIAWNMRGNTDAEVKGNTTAINFASDLMLHFIRRCIAKLTK